jgi:hypothetical protein
MRHAMTAMSLVLAAGAAMTIGAGPAAAFDYPRCVQGRDFGIPVIAPTGRTLNAWPPRPGARPIAISIRASRSSSRVNDPVITTEVAGEGAEHWPTS